MAASCTATCAHRADAATTGTGSWRRRPVMRQGPVPARQVYQAATQAFAAPPGYNLLIQLASSLCLIPYFLCAAFGLKTATRPGAQAGAFLVTSAVATLYGAWLIYAGGLSFLLMSMILYAPGIAFFVYARRERGLPAFVTGVEKGFAGLIVTLALVALYMIASGQLAL
ncbi:probable amino acid permease [Laribacter hongkongensis HLHK9]|uniref:Probable amino acid permease n=2 Tax=Laribacter hongkongensis TaxID=168471 RepID=C1D9X5_LARHH|nr:probable amino acid permease [Laribacter hongkongensis HLHK9]